MPIVIVRGLLPSTTPEQIATLAKLVRAAFVEVPEFNIKEDDVFVDYTFRKYENDIGPNFAINVHGLFDKPERTEDVRNELAGLLATAVIRFATEAYGPDIFIATAQLDPPWNTKKGGYAERSMAV